MHSGEYNMGQTKQVSQGEDSTMPEAGVKWADYNQIIISCVGINARRSGYKQVAMTHTQNIYSHFRECCHGCILLLLRICFLSSVQILYRQKQEAFLPETHFRGSSSAAVLCLI